MSKIDFKICCRKVLNTKSLENGKYNFKYIQWKWITQSDAVDRNNTMKMARDRAVQWLTTRHAILNWILMMKTGFRSQIELAMRLVQKSQNDVTVEKSVFTSNMQCLWYENNTNAVYPLQKKMVVSLVYTDQSKLEM